MPIEIRLKSEYLSIGHVSSPEAFLAPYAITKSDNDGRELGREFPKSRKTGFRATSPRGRQCQRRPSNPCEAPTAGTRVS